MRPIVFRMPETSHPDTAERLRRERDQARAVAAWLWHMAPPALRRQSGLPPLDWLASAPQRPPWAELYDAYRGQVPPTGELPRIGPGVPQ